MIRAHFDLVAEKREIGDGGTDDVHCLPNSAKIVQEGTYLRLEASQCLAIIHSERLHGL
jgi:hypothetical protein